MRLPRDLSGSDLAQALRKLGYSMTRQVGSHLRLTTYEHGEHHLTIPQHTPLRIGTDKEKVPGDFYSRTVHSTSILSTGSRLDGLPLRASNEGSPRPRVARAQETI